MPDADPYLDMTIAMPIKVWEHIVVFALQAELDAPWPRRKRPVLIGELAGIGANFVLSVPEEAAGVIERARKAVRTSGQAKRCPVSLHKSHYVKVIQAMIELGVFTKSKAVPMCCEVGFLVTSQQLVPEDVVRRWRDGAAH